MFTIRQKHGYAHQQISYRFWMPAKMQNFAISGIKTPEKFQFLKPKTLDSSK